MEEKEKLCFRFYEIMQRRHVLEVMQSSEEKVLYTNEIIRWSLATQLPGMENVAFREIG